MGSRADLDAVVSWPWREMNPGHPAHSYSAVTVLPHLRSISQVIFSVLISKLKFYMHFSLPNRPTNWGAILGSGSIFLSISTSRLALRPIQPRIQYVDMRGAFVGG
jgi:hypothetical protein